MTVERLASERWQVESDADELYERSLREGGVTACRCCLRPRNGCSHSWKPPPYPT